MLIKLACGYEINPDLIEYINPEWPAHAKIGSRMFDLSTEELAQVRTYHTKSVVVDDCIECDDTTEGLKRIISKLKEQPDCSGAQHEKQEPELHTHIHECLALPSYAGLIDQLLQTFKSIGLIQSFGVEKNSCRELMYDDRRERYTFTIKFYKQSI